MLVRISIDTLSNVESVIRGSVLHWFVRVAQTVLGIEPKLIRFLSLDSIESAAKGESNEIHLPINKIGALRGLKDAIDIIHRYIDGYSPRCGKEADISGGIPPELTAEVAEHIKVFGGSGREKKSFFELCEDVLALAELGAFFSFCGIRKTERGSKEFHYVFTEVIGEVGELGKKLEYTLNLRNVMRRLVENDAPLNTMILGATTCIARYLRVLPYDVRINMINRGITFEYLRLERGKVLNISGFNILSVTELVKIIQRMKIVTPMYVLIRSYPSENDFNKNRDLKKLKELIDGIAKDLVLYVNNVQSISVSKDDRYIVRREPIYLYNIVRRVKIFIDDLDESSEKLLNSHLKPDKYDIRSVLESILNGVKRVTVWLG